MNEKKVLNVLIACEESQAVCKEFRALGHRAFSCDVQDCSGGFPEWHVKGDVLPLLNGDCTFKTSDSHTHTQRGPWDLLIAHPPCTYLSNAGARWLYKGGQLNEERYKNGLDGKAFFMRFIKAKCSSIAVENPIPSSVYEMPPYTQIIQPYEYGEPWSKKTCLWLKGLPPLVPTNIVEDHRPYCSSGSYSIKHDPKYKGASRAGGSAKSRSKTFPGIAKAMAEQWSDYLINGDPQTTLFD